MKHLLRQEFRYFFWNLPCRRSFVRSPRTIPSPQLINEPLRRRIERVHDSRVSITPLLRERGNQTPLPELRSIISSLHRSNRFSHALQVSEWMSDQKAYKLTSMDLECRLLLIAKVRGVEEAAKFFVTVPVEKRDLYLHTALLNCCTTHRGSLSLAEITFQKMRDLGFADHNAQLYSTMLSLYHQADNHDMVVNLLREMDDQDMKPQGLSFDKLFTSYSLASVVDIQGMERFLSKWEDMIQLKWVAFFFSGLVYIQAGSKEKGLALLRRSEPLIGESCCDRDSIYGGLMTAYCSENLTDDVYRLWNLAKRYGISFDSSICSHIICSFTKTGDLDEILEEWDECPSIDLKDFGFQNRCAKEEAEKVVNMLGKKESKWESLVNKVGKIVEDEDDKVEERMKRVAEAMEGRLHDRWNPKSSMALSAYACVQYVEGQRDMESTADILRLLNRRDQVLHAMDKDRLSLKMVEAIRGGGYVGGEE